MIDPLVSFRVAHTMLARVDRELRLLAVNPAWADRLGDAGRSLVDLVHPDDRGRVAGEVVGTAIALPREVEGRFRLSDGSWRDLTLRCARGDAESGELELSVRDASAELADVQRRFTAICETMQELVYTTDERGIMDGMNRAPGGLAIADIIGVPMLSFAAPEERAPMQARFDAVRERKVRIAYETEAMYPDGSIHNFSSRMGPIVDGERCVGVVLITQDITAERQAEEAKRRAELMLQQMVVDLRLANEQLQVQHARLLDVEQRERARLARELDIAQRIQAGVLPRDLAVPGLDIAVAMEACTELGGDYYDVRHSDDGCWIGIGDVAGHGVSAGLVMLMLQCAAAALTEPGRDVTPSEVLVRANAVLHDNIRARMASDEHITATLLRFYPGGRVVFAGAHEDLVVLRARTGVCERFATEGTWLGVVPDIAHSTRDRELRLEPGDTLLLYTDGLTEAVGADGRLFGIERVCAVLERVPAGPASAVVDEMLAELHGFYGGAVDDITVMALRYAGSG